MSIVYNTLCGVLRVYTIRCRFSSRLLARSILALFVSFGIRAVIATHRGHILNSMLVGLAG